MTAISLLNYYLKIQNILKSFVPCSLLNIDLQNVVSSTPRPHFTPGEDPVPILQEAGWTPGPVWTGGKSRPHRDSIPDLPARSSVAIPTELPGPLLKKHGAAICRRQVLKLQTLRCSQRLVPTVQTRRCPNQEGRNTNFPTVHFNKNVACVSLTRATQAYQSSYLCPSLLYSFLNLAPDGAECQTSRSGLSILGMEQRYPQNTCLDRPNRQSLLPPPRFELQTLQPVACSCIQQIIVHPDTFPGFLGFPRLKSIKISSCQLPSISLTIHYALIILKFNTVFK